MPRKFVSRYGVVGINPKKQESRRLYQISEIVENPKISEAPSNLTIVGGYALTPAILKNLKDVEVSLTSVSNDALLINEGFERELGAGGLIYGWEFGGRRLDCGTIKGFRNAEEILRQN